MGAMLTLQEVEEMFGAARNTVLTLVERGELRATKVGTRWRFKQEWLDEYLAAQEAKLSGQTERSRELHRAGA